ncbi:hypothetical protein GCM10017786_23470 [Amycolatopsis deserti]|uniref:Uncharacterized protein n=1 Tax=Amycolatopsis deserti TaxID=185696 RepID=A0ABQ3IPK1_9PSEU|nr:hypothetical protein GCM10017786_23470 [Amycolatopsis deserti]
MIWDLAREREATGGGPAVEERDTTAAVELRWDRREGLLTRTRPAGETGAWS